MPMLAVQRLTGALIASTAEGGQTNLSTQDLVVADLQDQVLDVNAGFSFQLLVVVVKMVIKALALAVIWA